MKAAHIFRPLSKSLKDKSNGFDRYEIDILVVTYLVTLGKSKLYSSTIFLVEGTNYPLLSMN